jgi:4-diphosphocytidyl-2C-methyl-D-erythritol kinase
LVCPEIVLANKTPALYGRLTPRDLDDGQATHASREALRSGRFPADRLLVNTFAKVADAAFPGLAAVRARLESAAGAGRVHLSGAGPSLFVVAADETEARRLEDLLRREGLRAYATKTVGARPAGGLS